MTFEDLRKRAEAAVSEGEEGSAPEPSRDELRRLLHELSIHQLELRMQNEDLRARELELAQARDRYFELFNLAPIGYVSIDAKAVIQEANLWLAEWLGRPRGQILGRVLSAFIDPRASVPFELFRRALFNDRARASLELDFVEAGGATQLPASLRGVWLASDRALVAILDLRAERRARELEERFAHRLIEQRDLDNARLASELHDGIGQSLSAVSVGLRSLEYVSGSELVQRLQALQEIVSKSIVAVRRLARGLYTSSVDDLGLGPALDGLVRDTQAATEVDISLEVRGGPSVLADLPLTHARLVFSVAREALGNALRHADPTTVTLRAWFERRALVFELRDDGRGFEPGETALEGVGLKSLSARARALGGALTIESAPGRGTELTLRVPT